MERDVILVNPQKLSNWVKDANQFAKDNGTTHYLPLPISEIDDDLFRRHAITIPNASEKAEFTKSHILFIPAKIPETSAPEFLNSIAKTVVKKVITSDIKDYRDNYPRNQQPRDLFVELRDWFSFAVLRNLRSLSSKDRSARFEEAFLDTAQTQAVTAMVKGTDPKMRQAWLTELDRAWTDQEIILEDQAMNPR